MLILRIGSLHVYREDDGIRFTIPTMHSSTILTQSETRELTSALVKLFRKPRKPAKKRGSK